jgi:A/G-specific adenine glycosylase
LKMESTQNEQSNEQDKLQDKDSLTGRLSQANTWGLVQGTLFSSLMLQWFDTEARILPWRQVRDPYRVLLSELMLQQTQVTTVIPYYQRFLERWPTIEALALAEDQDVLKAWEGLGYYSRARNLLAAARQVVGEFDGVVPCDENQLLKLKGVGEYTAGAIRSIAYNLPAAAVDGNVVRVAARLAMIDWEPGELQQRREVRVLIETIQPTDRPGDFNEALMDLGATICLPKAPRCADCPVKGVCSAYAEQTPLDYPRKKTRTASPVDELTCLIIQKGLRIHVNKRPDKGLLAGLYEFDWGVLSVLGIELEQSDDHTIFRELGQRRHVFTHRIWQMNACQVILPIDQKTPFLDQNGQWVTGPELSALPFPTALAAWRDQIVGELVAMNC